MGILLGKRSTVICFKYTAAGIQCKNKTYNQKLTTFQIYPCPLRQTRQVARDNQELPDKRKTLTRLAKNYFLVFLERFHVLSTKLPIPLFWYLS